MPSDRLRSVLASADPDRFPAVLLAPTAIARAATSADTLAAVRAVLDRLTPDEYAEHMKRFLDEGRAQLGEAFVYADILTVLHAAATLTGARSYLEIGVRRGRSMAAVLAARPTIEAVGFDLWQPGYAGMDNPGPDFVARELRAIAPGASVDLVSGDSHVTVPEHFARAPGRTFDLVTVDGDHSLAGALADLRTVLPRLALGGVLVFDDVAHPAHPWLRDVFRLAAAEDGGLACHEHAELGYGVAFAVRVAPRRGTARARLAGVARWLRG